MSLMNKDVEQNNSTQYTRGTITPAEKVTQIDFGRLSDYDAISRTELVAAGFSPRGW